jgi:uncharacterized membrane protein YqiK
MVTDHPSLAIGVGIVFAIVVALVFLAVLFRAMWRVAEPNEALVISGIHHRQPAESLGESLGFKIVTGRGTLVIPGVQVVRKLSLDLNEADLDVDCVTRQGIPVKIRAVAIYKVGDDFASIANAARRFLDQQDRMDARMTNVLAGHLRAIVGSLTVEELIRERDKLTDATRTACAHEMEKLGLVIDSLQIQEIADPTGYIQNLARPHAVEVLKAARMAQADADRAATETEQNAEALKAAATRESKIKQSGYQAEIDRAAATAKMAGPLAEAEARQNVVVEETKIAELQAQLKEQELLVTIRRPADAAAYEKTTVARAQRDADIASAEARARQVELQAEAEAKRTRVVATAEAEHVRVQAIAQAEATRSIGEAEAAAAQAKGLAEGEAVRARGLAEAQAIAARADALSRNQEAVVAQQLAEQWPAIVRAASESVKGIGNMTVLNGGQGVMDLVTQLVGQGAVGFQLARKLIAQTAPARNAETEPARNGVHDGTPVA